MNQDAYRDVTVPIANKVLALTEHMTDYTLCQNILMEFEGVRLYLLKDHVPGGAAKSMVGVPFVDIFVKSRINVYVAFHADLTAPMPEEIPGVGYLPEPNETNASFYDTIGQDVYNWLVNKVAPQLDTTVH